MDEFKQMIDKEIIKEEILINLQKYELTNENLVYLLQIVKKYQRIGHILFNRRTFNEGQFRDLLKEIKIQLLINNNTFEICASKPISDFTICQLLKHLYDYKLGKSNHFTKSFLKS